MLIQKTISQLQVRADTPERAKELGQLGYIQWLGALPGNANYEFEAVRAFLYARPFISSDPAVAAFCHLLRASLKHPLQPLDLALPKPRRRGGAHERRMSL